MEGSRIDLKTFLGFAKPNQYSQSARKQVFSCFGVIILGQNPQTFMIPIYSTTVLYDTSNKITLSYYVVCILHSERSPYDLYSGT